jgi:hypothetical protein
MTLDRIPKCDLKILTERNGGKCVFSHIYKVSVGMILERIIIIIIISRGGGITTTHQLFIALRKGNH